MDTRDLFLVLLLVIVVYTRVFYANNHQILCSHAVQFGYVHNGVAHVAGYLIKGITQGEVEYFNGPGVIYDGEKLVFNGTIWCTPEGNCRLFSI